VLRRTRTTAALAASLVVLTGALAACGSDTPGTGLSTADRLDAVTVDGDIGAASLEWKERMTADGLESETLVEGTGAPLEDGDEVFVNYAFGNGYTRQTAIDSFGEDAPAVQITVGADEIAEPGSLDDVLSNLLRDYVKAGVTRGTRLAITGDSLDFFPTINQTQLGALLATEGIGNDDPLVMVVDVMDVDVLPGPEGKQANLPGWAPKIEFNGNGLTGLDFAGLDKPKANAPLVSTVLKKGAGQTVEKGDLIVADYLGEVFDADKPFDETFSADKEPVPFPIGLGAVVKGWDEVLVGQTVGSRVIMRIPPAKAYGANPPSPDIPKNSTLYFVVDILAAA
jgi:peptidylprolyl isomerase